MSISRRDVLRGGLAATALGLMPTSCGSSSGRRAPAPGPAAPPVARRPVKKKILILGGTGFLGPKTIEVALARGHQVTIFNRGKREKIQPLEMEVEHLYGNRDPDLPASSSTRTAARRGSSSWSARAGTSSSTTPASSRAW
jgi:2'-hydroxyisoflavone reductase